MYEARHLVYPDMNRSAACVSACTPPRARPTSRHNESVTTRAIDGSESAQCTRFAPFSPQHRTLLHHTRRARRARRLSRHKDDLTPKAALAIGARLT